MVIKKLITVQDSDNLSRYFNEIKNYKSLTKEEERELIKLIQKNKDRAALDKLTKANLKFVISVAKHYQGQGVQLLDLIASGNMGLIEAANRFDVTKDHKFFSYAVWWIRIMIFTTLDLNKRTIQLPANRELLVTRVKREILLLEQDLNRYPTPEELEVYIAKKFKKEKKANPPSADDIRQAIIYSTQTKSINEKLGDEDEDTLEQLLPSDDLGIDQDQREDSMTIDLNRFLYQLTQYEYDVLVLNTGLNKESILRTVDIAKGLKLKEKDVIKLKAKALKRLKRLKNIESLQDYLV
jgi:RNA polymerase primary sigma factor